ncbi:MAG: flagellar biosynthesis anti-sigma factor FlgM [Vallitalea sp.]|jgi:negative regulator of flagellin synthesis FlgM|nr:flagellar biosynthesis anti-sigma factor FlgM [Vallitalea sp.]
MRIDGIKNVNQAYKVNSANRISKMAKVKKDKDSLALSDMGKDLQVAKKAVNNAPDIRYEKVNNIKKRLQSGTYNVTAKEVADKIVDRYFDERG